MITVFIPPPSEVWRRGGILESPCPSDRLSVRLSLRPPRFCSGHSFQTMKAISLKLHTQTKHLWKSEVHKNHYSATPIFELLPFADF